MDWSVKAAALASVLVYVLVGSHVSLNDTIGWENISDKVKEDLETSSALRVPVFFFAGLQAEKWDFLELPNSSFFYKMRITWATTSNNERKINRIKNLRIFLPWKYKFNARNKVRKCTFLEELQKIQHTVYMCTVQTLMPLLWSVQFISWI